MEIASAYLRKTESLEGLLFDFARISAMETAAVYRISDNGDYLKGMAGAGTVGGMPDLPLDALSTASWACLRGKPPSTLMRRRTISGSQGFSLNHSRR